MNLINLASWTWLWETINGLFLIICNWIYILIGWLYQVFEAVARVNLFSRETFDEITSRIYIIMGVAMLFIFAYNIILMIINPEDKKSTGNTGKIVKETIISLVLVVLLPLIFNYMYIFQNNILESNILGKIILGPVSSSSTTSCKSGDYDCTCDFTGYGLDKYLVSKHWYGNDTSDKEGSLSNMCKDYKNLSDSVKGAYSIAPILMSAFYKPVNFTFDDCVSYLQTGSSSKISGEDEQICVNYFYDVTASKYTGDVKPFVLDEHLKNVVSDSSKNLMDFNALLAIGAGLLGAWMFLCYAMEIGVRVAKLGVLQIISPIAVMMRIIPKQKEAMFDKWMKNLINTYLDVFIRLLIIFFSLFAITLVPDVIDTLFASLKTISSTGTVSTFVIKTLALVVVILGILKFAQQAPDLLKEFFGGLGSGSFSLKSPAKQLSENKLAMGGLGAAGGLAKTGIGNTIRGYKHSRELGRGRIASISSGLKHGVGGAVAGGYRGLKEGYKTNDLKNLGAAIDRAKATSDENYYKRQTKKDFRRGVGLEWADELEAEGKLSRAMITALGANTEGRYRAFKNAAGNTFQQVKSWGGSSAMNDAKRNANNEVKGYASTALDAIDSQTKGMVKSYESQRDERVSNARPEEIEAIRKEYSNYILENRAETIATMDAAALTNLQKSIENMCDSIKNNQDFLENFTGANGALQNSIKDVSAGMSDDFKKVFEGSLDDFSGGLKDYLTDSTKFSGLNSDDRKAIVNAIDKITKTTDNNLRGIANEAKKQSDKK